ncbi:unnamed protein product [Prunus armeniaca]|uniref:Uncharacterized protein n=1 Tax=Prunus armeniaca TaxID=36596 RepID=A0A6J5WV54_PRUAR|nr:unnamed protein product [Prunus armeniaca]
MNSVSLSTGVALSTDRVSTDDNHSQGPRSQGHKSSGRGLRQGQNWSRGSSGWNHSRDNQNWSTTISRHFPKIHGLEPKL